MKEELYRINQKGEMRDLVNFQLCGTTFPDKSYLITRPLSAIWCIEYVEEDGKRVPTVNRTQSDTIFDDAEYLNAVKYATPEQRTVYEAEAKRIDEI